MTSTTVSRKQQTRTQFYVERRSQQKTKHITIFDLTHSVRRSRGRQTVADARLSRTTDCRGGGEVAARAKYAKGRVHLSSSRLFGAKKVSICQQTCTMQYDDISKQLPGFCFEGKIDTNTHAFS